MSNPIEVKVSLGLSEEGFKMLAQQKATLYNTVLKAGADGSSKEEEDLTGILHFLDHIQDEAVEEGVPQEIVFPNL